MTVNNLDSLFVCLQPYLKILTYDPAEIIQLIIRSFRQKKEPLDIARSLTKKKIRLLEDDVLNELKGSIVPPETIIGIQRELSNIDADAPFAGLDKEERLLILNCFFPRSLIYQSAPDKEAGKRYVQLAYQIKDPEKRNFYNWCIAISKDDTINNYIGCFFTGKTDIARACRDQFAKLFESNPEQPLNDMTERCQVYLDKRNVSSWSEEQQSELRVLLSLIGSESIERMKKISEKKADSRMFPPGGKDSTAQHLKESVKIQINECSLAAALAKIIAVIGIIVETTPTDKFAKQEEAICNIWGWNLENPDDGWSEKMLEGMLAFDADRQADAWSMFEHAQRLHGNAGFSSPDEARRFADMLCCQAHLMIVKGYGIKTDENMPEEERKQRIFQAAYQKMQEAWKIAAEYNGQSSPSKIQPYSPRSYYEYAFHACRKLRNNSDVLSDTAKDFLKRAARGECIEAILLLAQLKITGAYGTIKDPSVGVALLEDDKRFVHATEKQNRERISLLAAYYAASEHQELAERYYEKAARLGSYEATTHLRKLHMKPKHEQIVIPAEPNGKKICLFNTDISSGTTDMNAILLSSLPIDLWEAYGQTDFPALTKTSGFSAYSQVVFSLMSTDESKNLTDAIELLRFLNGVVSQQEASVRDGLIDRIDIYLLNSEEVCPLLLDAAMGNLDEHVYFRVHVCDPDLMSANELITRYPTFLPCISKKTGEIRTETWPGKGFTQRCKRRIVILGTNRSTEVLIKQLMAVTFLASYPTELTVVGPDADSMQLRLWDEYPGLDQTVDRYTSSYIIPSFYRCEMKHLPLNRPCEGIDAELQQRLQAADYLIISGANDFENLTLGVNLRRNLLRHTASPDHQPFIAIRYRDHHTAWIASQVAVSSRNYTTRSGWAYRHHWSEDYDLHLFGSNDAFGYSRLFNAPIERLALELHKSYYGVMFSANAAAEGDYYRRSYNRDSSMAALMGVFYQCFAMGVYYHDPRSYAGDHHCVLGERYFAILHDYCPECGTVVRWNQADNDLDKTATVCSICGNSRRAVNEIALEKAAEIEHARWRCFCASRGWSAPDEDVLISYLRSGNPKHHLEIGLLHPYMASYSNLPNIRNRINHLIDEYNLELSPLPDPCASDREFVLKAPLLLGYAIPPSEKKNNQRN